MWWVQKTLSYEILIMARRRAKRRNERLRKRRRTIVFNVDVAKRRKTRRKPGKRSGDAASSRLSRTILVGVILFFLIAPVLIFWSWFIRDAGFTVKWIRVDKTHVFTERDILSLADIRIGSNLLSADLEGIRKRICVHPDIKNAVVSRKIPGGILIKVYERFPVAAIHYGRRYVVDEDGVVLSIKKERRNRCLPFLMGLRLRGVRVGDKLQSPRVKKAIEVVRNYRETELCRQIELVSVDMSDPKNVMMRSDKIEEIRLGGRDLDERMRLLSYILKQRSDRGLDGPARYIDLRWNNITEMPLKKRKARRG